MIQATVNVSEEKNACQWTPQLIIVEIFANVTASNQLWCNAVLKELQSGR